MSFIKDTFFGGAEKNAAQSQEQAFRDAQQITRESAEQARGDLFSLFPSAQQAGQQGFQGALDAFSQSIPQQQQALMQGNVGAQQAILAGLPQMQNALLGGNVDYSQLQPVQVNPFAQTQQQQQPMTEQDAINAVMAGRGTVMQQPQSQQAQALSGIFGAQIPQNNTIGQIHQAQQAQAAQEQAQAEQAQATQVAMQSEMANNKELQRLMQQMSNLNAAPSYANIPASEYTGLQSRIDELTAQTQQPAQQTFPPNPLGGVFDGRYNSAGGF